MASDSCPLYKSPFTKQLGSQVIQIAYQIDCLVATQALWVVIFQDQISQKNPLYPQVISHMENGSFIDDLPVTSGDVPWLY